MTGNAEEKNIGIYIIPSTFLTLTTVNSKLKLEGFEITNERNSFNMCELRMYRLALLSKEHAFKHFARCD